MYSNINYYIRLLIIFSHLILVDISEFCIIDLNFLSFKSKMSGRNFPGQISRWCGGAPLIIFRIRVWSTRRVHSCLKNFCATGYHQFGAGSNDISACEIS